MVRLHDVYGMHEIFEPGFPGLLEAFYVQERLMESLIPDLYQSFVCLSVFPPVAPPSAPSLADFVFCLSVATKYDFHNSMGYQMVYHTLCQHGPFFTTTPNMGCLVDGREGRYYNH